MKIEHHLTDELLLAYAAGTLTEAFSLVAATHLSMCDDCRARHLAFEALGGAVLDQSAATMAPDALDDCLARLEAPELPAAPQRRQGLFPTPLAGYAGHGPDTIRWQRLGGGIRQAILPVGKSGGSARLLHIPAGAAVPDHGHRGLELTLVLQGAFRDETSRFGPGDVEIATEATDHKPIAEPGDDCICLAATDAPLRFHGWIPRLLQPVFRI